MQLRKHEVVFIKQFFTKYNTLFGYLLHRNLVYGIDDDGFDEKEIYLLKKYKKY